MIFIRKREYSRLYVKVFYFYGYIGKEFIGGICEFCYFGVIIKCNRIGWSMRSIFEWLNNIDSYILYLYRKVVLDERFFIWNGVNFEELIVIRLVSDELIVYSDNVLLCNNRIVLL